MSIVHHKLQSAEYVPTVHTSGTIQPTLVLIHDTASRLTKGNVVKYLKKNNRKVSYHAVIERDGTIVQMAPFNARCHHAGRSSWKGRKYCNGFSIGIGMVNPGPLKGTTSKAKAWYGQTFEDGLVSKDTTEHGRGHIWLEYTSEQVDALNKLVADIRSAYPGIEVAGHYHVSPGRKVDPTPLLAFSELGEVPTHSEPPAAPAHEVLKKKSREYKVVGALKKTFAGGTVVTVANEITKSTGTDKIKEADAYLTLVKNFISEHGVWMLLISFIGGWLATEAVQYFKRQSYDEGRVEPSGEAE